MQLLLNSLVSLIIRKLPTLGPGPCEGFYILANSKGIFWLQQNIGMSWCSQPATESPFGHAFAWVLQDCCYYFGCGLDTTIGHFVASISQKSLQNSALSKNGLWLLCCPLKYLVEVTYSIFWGQDSFHTRVKKDEESGIKRQGLVETVANCRFCFRRFMLCWTYCCKII